MTDYSYYDALLRYCELRCGIYSKTKETASEAVVDQSYYEKMLNYLELRYNHNHDSKGRFCSGSGEGGNSSVKTYGAELASKIIPPDKKKVIKALVNRVKSDIIDTGEHEMYPESIAGVKRGSPMTFDEADHGRGNPNYSAYFKDEYANNCQSCIVAHEARMRGYNVYAKGFDENDVIMSTLSHYPTKAWIDPKTGKEPRFTDYNGTADKCGNWLDKTVKQGERYSIGYSHSSNSHIISAFRDDNGVICLYDPQTGHKTVGIEAITVKFGSPKIKIHDIGIFRVDNLDFNLTFTNAVLVGNEK